MQKSSWCRSALNSRSLSAAGQFMRLSWNTHASKVDAVLLKTWNFGHTVGDISLYQQNRLECVIMPSRRCRRQNCAFLFYDAVIALIDTIECTVALLSVFNLNQRSNFKLPMMASSDPDRCSGSLRSLPQRSPNTTASSETDRNES